MIAHECTCRTDDFWTSDREYRTQSFKLLSSKGTQKKNTTSTLSFCLSYSYTCYESHTCSGPRTHHLHSKRTLPSLPFQNIHVMAINTLMTPAIHSADAILSSRVRKPPAMAPVNIMTILATLLFLFTFSLNGAVRTF